MARCSSLYHNHFVFDWCSESFLSILTTIIRTVIASERNCKYYCWDLRNIYGCFMLQINNKVINCFLVLENSQFETLNEPTKRNVNLKVNILIVSSAPSKHRLHK